jgi:ribosomal protein S6
MTEQDIKENNDLGDELGLYELGFHILSTISEENLASEVSNIKSIIEKNGGLFIGEEGQAKSIRLVYNMSKVINNQRKVFDTAYFGWVKFEANPDSISKMREKLSKVENILRFLLIKSVRESKMVSKKPSMMSLSYGIEKKTKEISKEKEPISEVQVDKAIDELIVE